MQASIGDLIAAKKAADETKRARLDQQMVEHAKQLASISNPLVDDHIREGVRLTRLQRRERISEQARVMGRVKASITLGRASERAVNNAARNQRDAAIAFILTNTSTRKRKDGTRYMQAKPGKADLVHSARQEASMLSKFVRPKRGYPRPPARRDASYPSGGLWGAPRGGVCIKHVRAEHSRLAAYFTAVKDNDEPIKDHEQAIESPCSCKLCRLHRMAGHLRWLDRKIANMCSR